MNKTTTNDTKIAIAVYGVNISVSLEDHALRDEVLARLPPGWLHIHREDVTHDYRVITDRDGSVSVTINGGTARRFLSKEALLDFLEGDIQIFVAEFAMPHLFVHAGVVAVDGRAIIIPGRSFAGKSTLTTSLVKAGATYYSDEYAVLDFEGRVHPYPRRVSLRKGPHGDAGRLDFSHLAPPPDDPDAAIPVGLVALLKYDADAGWDIQELDHLEAIMAISEQTVAIQRRPADTFAILDKVASGATVIQGTRGDVSETVERVLRLIG